LVPIYAWAAFTVDGKPSFFDWLGVTEREVTEREEKRVCVRERENTAKSVVVIEIETLCNHCQALKNRELRNYFNERAKRN